jgi:hypothetical protein
MSFFLLALGLLTTAAGCVMIGFGIPNNAFSLGNTLIVSGTVAISSGLILIALAAALGQLRRIADILNGRSLGGAARSPETVETLIPANARATPAVQQPSQSSPRAPTPPRSVDTPDVFPAEPNPAPMPYRPPEPRFEVGSAAAPPGPLDWLRAKTRPGAAAPTGSPVAESTMVEVHDEAPLSPRPPRPAEPAEPKMWPTPARPNGAPEVRPLPRATPQPEAPKKPDVHQFDAVWDRPAPAAAETNREDDAPPPGVPRRDDRSSERRAEPAAKSPFERTPTILKSGVIDGMPYTLYADGSIEAQLPQGTVRFASVDALRAHLEKHG